MVPEALHCVELGYVLLSCGYCCVKHMLEAKSVERHVGMWWASWTGPW